MSRYKTISTYTDVDVDLSEWSTEELMEELASRADESYEGEDGVLYTIWRKRRLNEDYQRELDELIYARIGKIS